MESKQKLRFPINFSKYVVKLNITGQQSAPNKRNHLLNHHSQGLDSNKKKNNIFINRIPSIQSKEGSPLDRLFNILKLMKSSQSQLRKSPIRSGSPTLRQNIYESSVKIPTLCLNRKELIKRLMYNKSSRKDNFIAKPNHSMNMMIKFPDIIVKKIKSIQSAKKLKITNNSFLTIVDSFKTNINKKSVPTYFSFNNHYCTCKHASRRINIPKPISNLNKSRNDTIKKEDEWTNYKFKVFVQPKTVSTSLCLKNSIA